MAAVWDSTVRLDERMNLIAQQLRERVRSNPVPMSEFGDRAMTDLSYNTGALMFYMLYRTLEAEAFDRRLAAYFEEYRPDGNTTTQFTSFFESSDEPAIGHIFSDWLFSTAWFDRLEAGESLDGLIASYREDYH